MAAIKNVTGPSWFSIIADEATDVCNTEQLNLSIRWVSDDYEAHEDSIAFFRVPDTKSETLFSVIKDLLIRCNLPLTLCRGQAYDGAANMQGRRNGVAAKILRENRAAIPVHCFAHSLNLCLQGAGKSLVCLRDAIQTVREITNLIRFSPKRLHLFSSNLSQEETSDSAVKLKPLCPTRWTARTGAIEAILKDYSLLMDTLEEIHETTHDEYGLKASGLLHSLEKFNTLFGLRLGHNLFGAAENVSLTLQRKNITIQDALTAIDTAKKYFKRVRSEEEFNQFYEKTVKLSDELNIGAPELPSQRRRTARYESGSSAHVYMTAKSYFRHLYYEACDLLTGELERRFENRHVYEVLSLEHTLVRAANGDNFHADLKKFGESDFGKDIDLSDLTKQLPFLCDVIKKATPSVKKVTSVNTICEAMNSNEVFKGMLPAVHHLIRLYKTVPITSSTSERSFSALKRLHIFTFFYERRPLEQLFNVTHTQRLY